jgi:thioredoxin-related protein
MKALLRCLAALAASASLALAGEAGWLTDWEAAKARAKAGNKPILINLIGSDWCGWCIKIEQDVFSRQAFKDYAAANLVLMEVDFPRKKELPAALREQNAELKKRYLNGGYPTVYLLDAEGNKLSGDLGELKGGVDAYLATLRELLAKLPAK